MTTKAQHKMPRGCLFISEYIYISSHKPINLKNAKYFAFSTNMDEKSSISFAFSKNFDSKSFQVGTYAHELPNKKQMQKRLKGRFLHDVFAQELYELIVQQFEDLDCKRIELLFAYNGYENEEIIERKIINLSELLPKDLYFQHMRFLIINKNKH